MFKGTVLHAISFDSGLVRMSSLKVINDKEFLRILKKSDFSYNKFMCIVGEKVIPITARMTSSEFKEVFYLDSPMTRELLSFDDSLPLKERLFTKKLYTEIEKELNHA